MERYQGLSRRLISASLVIALLGVAVCVGLTSTPTQAQLADAPWPMFHYDLQHTGRSPYSGPATPALKWRYATGDRVFSSPAIGADGTIYAGSYDKYLYALNPDGSLKWRYLTGDSVASSPAIGADGTIYVGSYDNNLYALNPDGTLNWSYYTGGLIISSSPAIGADGTIYVGSDDNNLYALNRDGSLKWSYATGYDIKSSAAIGADGTIYVGSDDHYVYALNPDGTLKWRYATGGWVYSSSPAIGADGTIYVGSHDNYLYALNPDGSLKWRYLTGYTVSSSPAIGADGTIYVGSYDKYLYALNPDGTLNWRYATVGLIKYSSPAVDADGTIYVGSEDNYLYAMNPDGTLKWRYATEGYVFSSPTIGADGTIYVGSWHTAGDNYIYAIGEAPDTTPPAAVTNLATSGATASSITLTWTAPGDDGNVGTASQYDIRYSTSTITDTNWGSTTPCTGEPSPQAAGGSETFVVTSLSPDTTYYFALKTADEVPNWSDLSNVASGTTSSAPGSISGAIYEQDGTTPVSSSITISAYDWNTDALVASTATSTGTYISTGLPAGDYKVGASGTGYVDEYYQEETSLAQANRVRVTAGQDTPNIDFTLSRVYPISPPSVVDDSDYSGAIVEFLDSGVPVEVAVVLSHQNPGTDIQGFKLSGDYYDIVTIDPGSGNPYDYEGRVEITLPAGGKKNPKLFHWELVDAETGTWDWVKLDTTPNPDGTVSATVTSLSWFAIAEEEEATSGEGCFIATAAYGTSTAAELDTLRSFRDEVLLESTFGSQLVNFYYDVSPPVADFISENSLLKTIVRELLVDPIASLVEATEAIWGD